MTRRPRPSSGPASGPGWPTTTPGCPTSSTDDEYWARQAEWHTALYDAGFFGLSWPTRYGGHDLPTVFDVILDEELAAAGAPPRPSLGYLVQGISTHGSDAIKDRFLPGLISGQERWCQGFSEPDAGSDLASLRTTAVRDGDEYVINGHKIWTSYSDVADWCILLARTDPDVPKHKGLSAFAVPMDQPGIEQRPLRMINGITNEFGQVLFDGARVAGREHDRRARRGVAPGDDDREPRARARRARLRRPLREDGARSSSRRCAPTPAPYRSRPARGGRVGARAGRDAAPPRVPPALGAARRRRPRPRRLDRQAAHDLGRADRRARRARRCRARERSSTPTTSR